ncbi:hypothetical protein [Streptomyces bicolor]|uniref:hypothetical protein n=1 Tax=Streptomyces bicolor TaxID=66874 RepID=UPI0004E2291F|nr:hypothetical protein [Streptomyces bicolor]
MTAAQIARCCAAGALFVFAALVVLFAFGGTVEMEAFPGLRENMGPVVVWMLVFALLPTAGAVALAGRRSRIGWVAAGALAVLVALRLWTLAPMLHCWSYDSVWRDEDGSYRCADRGDMLP